MYKDTLGIANLDWQDHVKDSILKASDFAAGDDQRHDGKGV